MSSERGSDDADKQRLDPEQLRRETGRMIDALTDPRYVAAVRAVRAAPDDERLAEATRQLSSEGLRKLGVPIPEGMRLSSRYFEPGLPGEIELGDSPAGERNMISTLNEAAPGLLDRLRVNEPDLFKALAVSDDRMMTAEGDLEPLGIMHCACGGGSIPGPFHGSVCSGAGVDPILF
jgi:hypothetical protein